MASEFEIKGGLVEELATASLLDSVSQFLVQKRPEGEMQHMDEEVAGVITPDEYGRYVQYKQFCLNELALLNQTPGPSGALCSAIERGFILGYWFAMQHNKEN